MACITIRPCKLAPCQWSAPAWDRQRSNSSQDTSQFVPSNKRTTQRGNPNERGQPLRRTTPFITRPVPEQRQTPWPATPNPAPPVYPTVIPLPYIEPTPSYHIYPPPPVLPSLLDNYQEASLPPTPFETPAPIESIVSGGSEIVGRTFQLFLPGHKYLATTVLTRSKKELDTFRTHCWYQLQGRQERHIEHLLSELTELCPDPIIFSGYLWKYRTSINNDGILEDYQIIQWTETCPQTAQLNRAYTIFYSWHNNSYTVSLAWATGTSLINNTPQSLYRPQKMPVTYPLSSLIGLSPTIKEIESDSPNSATKQFGTLTLTVLGSTYEPI